MNTLLDNERLFLEHLGFTFEIRATGYMIAFKGKNLGDSSVRYPASHKFMKKDYGYHLQAAVSKARDIYLKDKYKVHIDGFSYPPKWYYNDMITFLASLCPRS
jgi:hypothetical protein